jgi:hypothetical protein
MNWKGRGWEMKKGMKAPVRIVGAPAKIRTGNLPNTSQASLSQPVCSVMIDRYAANISCFVTSQVLSFRIYYKEAKSWCRTTFLIPECCRWPDWIWIFRWPVFAHFSHKNDGMYFYHIEIIKGQVLNFIIFFPFIRCYVISVLVDCV